MYPDKQVKSIHTKLANMIYLQIYYRTCFLLNASLVASCCSTRCSMHLVFVSKKQKMKLKSSTQGARLQGSHNRDFIGYDYTEVTYQPNLGLAGCHSVFKAHPL